MRVENVDDSVIWSEAVYQTLDVIYSLSVLCIKWLEIHCDFLTFVSG